MLPQKIRVTVISGCAAQDCRASSHLFVPQIQIGVAVPWETVSVSGPGGACPCSVSEAGRPPCKLASRARPEVLRCSRQAPSPPRTEHGHPGLLLKGLMVKSQSLSVNIPSWSASPGTLIKAAEISTLVKRRFREAKARVRGLTIPAERGRPDRSAAST